METRQFYRQPRPLTFDERRAAEAAFAGESPCSNWSEASWKFYEGLTAALLNRAGQSLAA
jgi:hypothetical protein